jgi:hypothetical protein
LHQSTVADGGEVQSRKELDTHFVCIHGTAPIETDVPEVAWPKFSPEIEMVSGGAVTGKFAGTR